MQPAREIRHRELEALLDRAFVFEYLVSNPGIKEGDPAQTQNGVAYYVKSVNAKTFQGAEVVFTAHTTLMQDYSVPKDGVAQYSVPVLVGSKEHYLYLLGIYDSFKHANLSVAYPEPSYGIEGVVGLVDRFGMDKFEALGIWLLGADAAARFMHREKDELVVRTALLGERRYRTISEMGELSSYLAPTKTSLFGNQVLDNLLRTQLRVMRPVINQLENYGIEQAVAKPVSAQPAGQQHRVGGLLGRMLRGFARQRRKP